MLSCIHLFPLFLLSFVIIISLKEVHQGTNFMVKEKSIPGFAAWGKTRLKRTEWALKNLQFLHNTSTTTVTSFDQLSFKKCHSTQCHWTNRPGCCCCHFLLVVHVRNLFFQSEVHLAKVLQQASIDSSPDLANPRLKSD